MAEYSENHYHSVAARIAGVVLAKKTKKSKKKTKKAPKKTKKNPSTRKKAPTPDPVFEHVSKASPREKDITSPTTEYSCRADLVFSADFEGSVNQRQLKDSLKREIVSAVKTAVITVSRSFQLSPTNVVVQPIQMDCAVVDLSSDDEF